LLKQITNTTNKDLAQPLSTINNAQTTNTESLMSSSVTNNKSNSSHNQKHQDDVGINFAELVGF
jgi:hypothetical protein